MSRRRSPRGRFLPVDRGVAADDQGELGLVIEPGLGGPGPPARDRSAAPSGRRRFCRRRAARERERCRARGRARGRCARARGSFPDARPARTGGTSDRAPRGPARVRGRAPASACRASRTGGARRAESRAGRPTRRGRSRARDRRSHARSPDPNVVANLPLSSMRLSNLRLSFTRGSAASGPLIALPALKSGRIVTDRATRRHLRLDRLGRTERNPGRRGAAAGLRGEGPRRPAARPRTWPARRRSSIPPSWSCWPRPDREASSAQALPAGVPGRDPLRARGAGGRRAAPRRRRRPERHHGRRGARR